MKKQQKPDSGIKALLTGDSVTDAVIMGLYCIDQKNRMRHGDFTRWVKLNEVLPEKRTVQKNMKLAKLFLKSKQGQKFNRDMKDCDIEKEVRNLRTAVSKFAGKNSAAALLRLHEPEGIATSLSQQMKKVRRMRRNAVNWLEALEAALEKLEKRIAVVEEELREHRIKRAAFNEVLNEED